MPPGELGNCVFFSFFSGGGGPRAAESGDAGAGEARRGEATRGSRGGEGGPQQGGGGANQRLGWSA